jgi:phenylacetate-CoA ligase
MEYAITEVIDEDNNNTDFGRLITTDLWNFATPFIRYDTQDIVELTHNECSCGRKLLPIKKIFGRDSDILITSSGQFLIANNFTGFFQWISEVEQFQVEQKELNNFEFVLKVNNNYSKQTENKIIEHYKKIISGEVKIQVKIVDDIPLTKSGKRRFLIRSNHIQLPV